VVQGAVAPWLGSRAQSPLVAYGRCLSNPTTRFTGAESSFGV
jgi:hypothetical protein